MTRPGLLLLAVAGILWGGGGPAGRMLAESGGLSSFEVAAGRTLVGGALLVLAALAMRRLRLRAVLTHRGTYTTAATMAAFQGFYFAAVATGPISVATLVTIGTAPVIVTVLEVLTGRIQLSWGVVSTRALALLGLALLVGIPGAGTPVSGPSVLLALAASTSFALMTYFGAGRRITVGSPPAPAPADPPSSIAVTGVAFLLSGLALAACGLLFSGGQPTPVPTGAAFGWLLVLGVVCTALPYACYFHGLTLESASMGSLLALLEPVTGTLLAVLLFGETISPVGYAGILLLLSGVALATRSRGNLDHPRSGS